MKSLNYFDLILFIFNVLITDRLKIVKLLIRWAIWAILKCLDQRKIDQNQCLFLSVITIFMVIILMYGCYNNVSSLLIKLFLIQLISNFKIANKSSHIQNKLELHISLKKIPNYDHYVHILALSIPWAKEQF